MHAPGKPLVSVIVPVYNGAAFLRESLDSILRQTYAPLEIIVLDDASTDATPDILREYSSRIRSIRQIVNLGQFENVNMGLRLASGEFVAVFHADDIYESTIVEREVEFLLNHPDVGAVFCLDRFIDEKGIIYGRLELPPHWREKSVLHYGDLLPEILSHKNRFLRTPGAMVRASVYRELGYFAPAPFGIAADLEMWLRIARRYPLGLLHEYLFSYRHFHGSLSQNYDWLRTEEEKFFVVMDRELANASRPKVAGSVLRRYAAHREEDKLKRAAAHYVKGDRVHARRVLETVRPPALFANERWPRLFLLHVLLTVVTRLPRSERIAELLLRRLFLKVRPAIR